MIVIARPVNDIAVNGLEYVLAENGEPIEFPDKEEAARYLIASGYANAEEVMVELDNGSLIFKEIDFEEDEED